VAIKEENTRRIRELEAEFSDERIAALFALFDEYENKKSKRVRRRKSRMTAQFKGFLVIVSIIIVVIILFLFNPRVTYERSMEDTIMPRDMIIVSVMAFDSDPVSFGDIIVHKTAIQDPEGGMLKACTRVIGLPGDILEIRDGYVYRNGEQLDEPYTKEGRTDGTMGQLLIPDNYYFVLGDNRLNSIDSRDHRIGLVNFGLIDGKVVFRVLPASRFGKIN